MALDDSAALTTCALPTAQMAHGVEMARQYERINGRLPNDFFDEFIETLNMPAQSDERIAHATPHVRQTYKQGIAWVSTTIKPDGFVHGVMLDRDIPMEYWYLGQFAADIAAPLYDVTIGEYHIWINDGKRYVEINHRDGNRLPDNGGLSSPIIYFRHQDGDLATEVINTLNISLDVLYSRRKDLKMPACTPLLAKWGSQECPQGS